MNPLNILCVDDFPQLLELRRATLESQGYCVKVASNGSIAMKILKEEPVDAVLLEYKLEGMDAEAIACHIKQQFPNLPIILLSAYTDMPRRTLSLVDEYVMKSEMPEGLNRAVQRVMHRVKVDEWHRSPSVRNTLRFGRLHSSSSVQQ